jgi:hypothetical protein
MLVSEKGGGGVGRVVGLAVYMYISRRKSSLGVFFQWPSCDDRQRLVGALGALVLVRRIWTQHHEASRFSSPGRAPD